MNPGGHINQSSAAVIGGHVAMSFGLNHGIMLSEQHASI